MTALRETLQDLRPDTRTRADYQSLFRAEPPDGVITQQWRRDRRVGRARLSALPDDIVDLEDLDVRRRLEEIYAGLLATHGMRYLDISRLRSNQRIVTQTIALELRTQGKAGLAYRANLDGGPCIAVFEGRTIVSRYGRHQQLSASDKDLIAAAAPWDLSIDPD